MSANPEPDYLQWRSDLSLQTVFAASSEYSYPQPYDKGLICLTRLHEEGGRAALVYLQNEQQQLLTPAGYQAQTQINEYGGKPFWLMGQMLIFANRADQCLYSQELTDGRAGLDMVTQPKQLSANQAGLQYRYGELCAASHDLLLSIVEWRADSQQSSQQAEPAATESEGMMLASLSLGGGAALPLAVESGADFYSNLVVDQDRRRLAWVEWNHPDMPWDDGSLMVAEYSLAGDIVQLQNPRRLEKKSATAYCQLYFASNGKLFFSADQAGSDAGSPQDYWNIYCLDPAAEQLRATRVTDQRLEFGYPHWQYGDQRISGFDGQSIVAIASAPEADQLFLIDQDTLEVSTLGERFGRIQSLCGSGEGSVFYQFFPPNNCPAIICRDRCSATQLAGVSTALSGADTSMPQHIEFVAQQSTAYGFYYAPCNSHYHTQGPPPLLVMVHGGPTARSYGNFDLQKQFWTTRGFAIFDVNHRGSSGYGRRFRDSLYGAWGEADIEDVVAGIKFLVDTGQADPERLCIRGKSAGGYAVLRVLTSFAELFKAGACYYGIGNLGTLAEVTHRFERFYTDKLLGEPYDKLLACQPESRYFQRSPQNYLQDLRSAMILFQGLDDNVVPPAVSREMVAALSAAGVPHVYVEYENEGHGFRQTETNIDAWQQELNFYRGVLAQ
ncbi:MAG: S9 family peptidase [Gammaproteobacteria bacterium]|nr:S9 family peptidase [Gammaproteobacteria bacterium]